MLEKSDWITLRLGLSASRTGAGSTSLSLPLSQQAIGPSQGSMKPMAFEGMGHEVMPLT